MILYFISPTRHLTNGRVQAAHRQVFQEDIAFAAASNGHFWQQFKAAFYPTQTRKVQFSDGAGIRLKFFTPLRLASARRRQLEGPRTLMTIEYDAGVAKAQDIPIIQQVFSHRLLVHKTIAASIIVA